MSRPKLLPIPRSSDAPSLTPAQKRFNTLIRQIEQARQRLASWHENLPAYREAYVVRLEPLQEELLAAARDWVFALDHALDHSDWNKTERTTLRDVLCEAAHGLLEGQGNDDAELKAVFDKHAEVDFDTHQREAVLALKEIARDLAGVDLDDDESLQTPDDVFERMRQDAEQRVAAEQALRQEQATRKRKTAAQQRRETDAQAAAQSVREVFRKLASALHPDREVDAAQRAAKTALMQRANQAYQANDLLALLELQLQVEQIDAGHMATASDSRLKHYNKVLQEQLGELRAEIDRLQMEWRMEFGGSPFEQVDPRSLHAVLERTRHQWQTELAQMQRDTRMLADIPATKRWLKRERQRLR